MENKSRLINRNNDKGKEEKQREDALAVCPMCWYAIRVDKRSGGQVWECPNCKQTSKWLRCVGGEEEEETTKEPEANDDEGRTSNIREEDTDQRMNRLREAAESIEHNWKANSRCTRTGEG